MSVDGFEARLASALSSFRELNDENDIWRLMQETLVREFNITTSMIAFTHSVHKSVYSGLSKGLYLRHDVPHDCLEAHDGLNLQDDVVMPQIFKGRERMYWNEVDEHILTPRQQHRLALDERLGYGAGVSIGGRFKSDIGAFCMCMGSRHVSESEFYANLKRREAGLISLVHEFERSIRPTMVANRLKLTPRQRQVIALAASGMPTKTIAAHLELKPKTIEHIFDRARKSLDASTTIEAVAKAIIFDLLG